MKRLATAILSLASLGFVGVGLGAPAHAAHVVHLCSDTSVEGNPGQTLVVVNGCPASWYFTNWGSVLQDNWNGSASASLASGASRTFTLGSIGTGSIADVYARYPSLAITVHDPNTTVITYPPFVGHDWLQQVGVPTSGTCTDVPSNVGHWRGAPVGGWTLSWAQWINDGRGGPVCTRELEDREDGTISLVSR